MIITSAFSLLCQKELRRSIPLFVVAIILGFGGIRGHVVSGFEPPSSAVRLQAPWGTRYQGVEVQSKSVIALWSFDGKDSGADGSGNGHHGELQGAKIVAKGRFGKALQSFVGFPVVDQPHGFIVKNSPHLTPAGPFSLEMWISPNQKMKGYSGSVLMDKKYVATGHTDYILSVEGKKDAVLRPLKMQLGFGTRSVDWYSDPIQFETDQWSHIAFTYDGAGTGQFFVDGQIRGSRTEAGVGNVMPGKRPLSIGDRLGSNYRGFPGRIDQVRISSVVQEFRPVRIQRITDRSVFRRMEKEVSPKFRVTNLQQQPLAGATLQILMDVQGEKPVRIPTLKSGEFRDVEMDFDTTMRPGTYQVVAALAFESKGASYDMRESFSTQIVSRPLPDPFPVLMWGTGLEDMDRLREIGFTHALGFGADQGALWRAGKVIPPESEEKVNQKRRLLDQALSKDFAFAASLYPGTYLRKEKTLHRVDRDGKAFTEREDICALNPKIADYCRNVGISMAKAYGDHPAFGAALLHSEVKGHARPCFHEHDRQAFRDAEGIEIPEEANRPRGVDYRKIKGFPSDRVIADDDALYRYYRWFWKDGMGWNQLNTEVHKGLQTAGREDFWTFYDPAVRTASVFGSGGDVDVISQWTYSYPDPLRIGLATDELLAMSAGAKRPPDVMKMTQVIWYRGQTAPEAKPGKPRPKHRAAWERQQPHAPFITMPPMQLREAFWTKIARPIKGIMYHGLTSLIPKDTPNHYRYTHPETQHELQRLVRTVIKPLGPTLKNVPGIKSDIAFYESFAAQVYARRGTYGWNGGWAGDSYHVAMWAGLQPEVVYDETITASGLDGYKVLFMTDCDVVTKSILNKVKAFQAQGGIVIGDANLTPAIQADIVIETYKRKGLAHEDKSALQARSAILRKALAGHYTRYLDSSNPDVVPYRRRFSNTDYVFLINDRREYGRYVGHHGRVMENGLPANSTILIRRNAGHAYDLVAHQSVPLESAKGALVAQVKLGPGQGRLLMITPQAIDHIKIGSPRKVQRGKLARIEIQVMDASGKPIDAIIPFEIRIEDAHGRTAEQSGHWAAKGGRAVIPIDIATNDTEGAWQIHVRELASGKSAAAYFRVGDPPSDDPDMTLMDKNAGDAVQPKG